MRSVGASVILAMAISSLVLFSGVQSKDMKAQILMKASHAEGVEDLKWLSEYQSVCSTKSLGQEEKYKTLKEELSKAENGEEVEAKTKALNNFLKRCTNFQCPATLEEAKSFLNQTAPGMQTDLVSNVCVPQYKKSSSGFLPHPECFDFPRSYSKAEVAVQLLKKMKRLTLAVIATKKLQELEALDCTLTFTIRDPREAWTHFKALTRRITETGIRAVEAEWIIDSLTYLATTHLDEQREDLCEGYWKSAHSLQEIAGTTKSFAHDDVVDTHEALKVLCKVLPLQ